MDLPAIAAKFWYLFDLEDGVEVDDIPGSTLGRIVSELYGILWRSHVIAPPTGMPTVFNQQTAVADASSVHSDSVDESSNGDTDSGVYDADDGGTMDDTMDDTLGDDMDDTLGIGDLADTLDDSLNDGAGTEEYYGDEDIDIGEVHETSGEGEFYVRISISLTVLIIACCPVKNRTSNLVSTHRPNFT